MSTQEALDRSAEDALTYIKAATVGASVHQAIADAAGISRRSADARIAKARSRGMLTPAANQRSLSQLTPLAIVHLDNGHPGWREEVPKPPQIEPTREQFMAAVEEFHAIEEDLALEWTAHRPIQGEATAKVIAYRLVKAALNSGPVKRRWVRREDS
jgi:hypothetical protein